MTSIMFLIVVLNGCTTNKSLEGDWQGSYTYPYRNRKMADVNFNIVISQKAAEVTGSTIEPNTFGDNSSETLEALIVGKVVDSKIDFVKTYNGKGGVVHSINYSGDISQDFNHIKGTWTIPKSWSGEFEMSRKSQRDKTE